MDFALDENETLLKDGVERFMTDRYGFDARQKRLAAAGGTDRAMWAQFAELGWLAVLVPEAHGGLGWGLQELAVIMPEFGKAMVAEPFIEGAVVAVSLLAGEGETEHGEVLAGIASGELLVVPALLEAGGRYDFAQPQVRFDGGVLAGRKILVGGGDVADRLVVSAMADDGLVLVLADASGVARNGYRLIDGSWAADVDLDGTPGTVIARGEAAQRLLAGAIDAGALMGAAQQVGSMERVLSTTAEYLRTRQQFGQPIGNFQALQHRLADLFIDAEMARSAMFGALSAIQRGDGSAMVSAARVRCDQAALRVGNGGIHMHGGMGMTTEYPVGHHYRRLVMLCRLFGDTEFHLERYEAVMDEAA